MEDNIFDSSQWVQSHDSLPFSDATATTISVHSTSVSPKKSCRSIDHHQHQFSPKSSGFVSKPIRRRSRASKRTPTTLLNANTTNFRSLVQQFTGCPRSPISLAKQRGPITLNFGAGSAENCSSSINFLQKFYRQQENWSQQNKQQQHYQQQQKHQQQYYSMEQILDNVSNEASNIASPNVEFEEDFVLEDFSMDELIGEYSFSNI